MARKNANRTNTTNTQTATPAILKAQAPAPVKGGDLATPDLIAAFRKDGGHDVGEKGALAAAKALKSFGMDIFESAVVKAKEALSGAIQNQSEIATLTTEIETKRYGISHKLLGLAEACAKLTMEGDTARLDLAADLMRDSCEFVEDEALVKYAKDHNGAETTISKIAGTWNTLKSEFINGMGKAALNPTTFVKPQAMRDAYKEWKEKNPEGRDNRGTRSRTTDSPGKTATVTVKEDTAKAAQAINKFTDSERSFIAGLVGFLQALSKEDRVEAIESLSDWLKDAQAMYATEDEKEDADAPEVRESAAPKGRENRANA